MQKIRKNSDIILIIILGAILRFKDLLKFDLWYDEAFTGILMRQKPSEFFYMLAKDSHPPLFNLIMKAWTFLFGVSDFSLRFLPFVFGVATVYVVYLIALNLADKETAAISAFLATINPFLISYSIEARSYSFYGLAAAVTFLALLKSKTNLFVIGIIIMTFTHYIGLAFVFVFLVLYLLMNFKNPSKLKKDVYVLIPLFGYLVFYVWMLVSKDTKFLNIYWVRDSNFLNILQSLVAYSFGIKSKLAGTDELVDINFIFNVQTWGGIFAGMFILGIIYSIFKRKEINLKILCMLIFSLIIPQVILLMYGLVFHKNLYVERYVFPSAIFYVLACGYLLSKTIKLEVAFFIILLYVFVLTRIQTPNYYTGMKSLASALGSYQNEIVFTSPIDFTIGKYYFGEESQNLRLLEPRNPTATYYHWPFLDKDLTPKNLKKGIFISPNKSALTVDFDEVVPKYGFGNYHVYGLSSQN